MSNQATKNSQSKQPNSSLNEADQSEKLQQQIAQLQAELASKAEAYKRARADYINLQQQTAAQRQQTILLATAGLVEDLLPVVDHLQLTSQHFEDPSIKMICDELQKTLQQHGLEELKVSIGQEFDHQVMEAVDTATGDQKQQNKVIKVAQPGYSLNGRVIRHAKVVVGQ